MVNQTKTLITVLQLVLLLSLISIVSTQNESTSEINFEPTTNPTEITNQNGDDNNTSKLDPLVPIQNNTTPITLQISIPSANSEEVTWEEKQYYLPQPIQILGQASGSLVSDQVVIDFNVETLDKLAGKSLNLNNEIIQNSVNLLLDGILQPTEISTQGVSIQKQVKYVYNNGTGQWDQVFEGYKVNNRLKIVTDKVDRAGEIIDIAVANGIDQIDSVQFLPLASNVKELQDSLISQAVEDATKKAHLALLPLGYEVCGVKRVDIIDNTNSGLYLKLATSGEASISDSSLLTSTPLFSGSQHFTVQVNVQFLITKSKVEVLVSPPA